jgi:hypothetical protein
MPALVQKHEPISIFRNYVGVWILFFYNCHIAYPHRDPASGAPLISRTTFSVMSCQIMPCCDISNLFHYAVPCLLNWIFLHPAAASLPRSPGTAGEGDGGSEGSMDPPIKIIFRLCPALRLYAEGKFSILLLVTKTSNLPSGQPPSGR